MSEHDRDTDFVIRIIAYDDTSERQALEERMRKARSDEGWCAAPHTWCFCPRRLLLRASLTRLFSPRVFPGCDAAFGWPCDQSPECRCARLAPCAVAFVVLGSLYRREFNRHREECRRLGMNLLESRLGQPRTPVNNAHPQPAVNRN